MSEKLVKCCYCNKSGKKSEMNFLLGVYSHPGCDDSYFERQEKGVKYLDKLRSEQLF